MNIRLPQKRAEDSDILASTANLDCPLTANMPSTIFMEFKTVALQIRATNPDTDGHPAT